MAVSPIACAVCAGKSVFDRAAILAAAHASSRHRMSPSLLFRSGDRWNEEAGGYVPKFCYREAFASALRWAWRDAKVMAADQAWEAAQPQIPADVTERADAFRAAAWFEPITTAGTARMRQILAEANDIEEAARLRMFTAQDNHHAC